GRQGTRNRTAAVSPPPHAPRIDSASRSGTDSAGGPGPSFQERRRAVAKPQATGAGDGPLVSIIIPVHNRADLTRQCLESLAVHPDPGVSTDLLVIDDCSTDETADDLRALGDRVRVFRNDQRRCFGHNMNFAATQARGKYLCLLNNDTYVTPGWLRALV